jgi:hypothetical protein
MCSVYIYTAVTTVRNIYDSEILCIYAAFVYVPMKNIQSSWPNEIIYCKSGGGGGGGGVHRRWRGVLFSIIGFVRALSAHNYVLP